MKTSTENYRCFYSTVSKRVFFIPNFYTNGSGLLNNLIENLTDAKLFMQEQLGINECYSCEITKSKRFQYMWLFQAPHNGENLPNFVTVIDFDMWDFIQ